MPQVFLAHDEGTVITDQAAVAGIENHDVRVIAVDGVVHITVPRRVTRHVHGLVAGPLEHDAGHRAQALAASRHHRLAAALALGPAQQRTVEVEMRAKHAHVSEAVLADALGVLVTLDEDRYVLETLPVNFSPRPHCSSGSVGGNRAD